jgi:hypothetical protein
LGFTQSKHDECVFYYGSTIFLVYTEDTILLGPNQEEIEKIVKLLGKNFKVDDQGTLNDYLGINIEERPDGKLEFTQPTLLLSIMKDVGLWDSGREHMATSRSTPAYHTTIPEGRGTMGLRKGTHGNYKIHPSLSHNYSSQG